MATALFITTEDIKKFTALNGNVDNDKFVQFIKIAQETHIQGFLGTNLYDKINDDIIADDLASPYTTLVSKFIKPMLCHWAMVEYLPFSAYTIANKGVYKHNSENSETVSIEELNLLIEKERKIAQSYTQRFLDHICNNSSLYPEYNTNSNGDQFPEKNSHFTGWML
jgi:hypothetical protein